MVAVRDHLGPYRIVRTIGSGGMGLVLEGEAADGTRVALKAIRPDLVLPAARERFEREGMIRIEHPNVVRVVDAGTDTTGVPYIAFELLSGRSLDRALHEGRLSPAEVIRIARQVCAGLSAAHEQGVVHRALKPANVFL